MSDKSAIEWTEATWNPVTGCNEVSPGCAHCYAKTFAERFRGVPGHPYESGFDLYVAARALGAATPMAKTTPLCASGRVDPRSAISRATSASRGFPSLDDGCGCFDGDPLMALG